MRIYLGMRIFWKYGLSRISKERKYLFTNLIFYREAINRREKRIHATYLRIKPKMEVLRSYPYRYIYDHLGVSMISHETSFIGTIWFIKPVRSIALLFFKRQIFFIDESFFYSYSYEKVSFFSRLDSSIARIEILENAYLILSFTWYTIGIFSYSGGGVY